MSKNISLKPSAIASNFKKEYSKYGGHIIFAAIILVLLIYVGVVLKINKLANAEPGADQKVIITSSVPHIDSKTIDQIQALENNNTQVHSLFEQARNNPFSE